MSALIERVRVASAFGSRLRVAGEKERVTVPVSLPTWLIATGVGRGQEYQIMTPREMVPKMINERQILLFFCFFFLLTIVSD